MISLREHIKSRLSDAQRRQVRTTIDSIKSIYQAPLRNMRRNGLESRLPTLPGGRGWRTSIPAALHRSLQRGTIDYQYRDVTMQKHPVEVALYLRLIWEARPGTIIEIGSQAGGSAVWMADVLEMYGIKGEMVSVDLNPPKPKAVTKAKFLQGDAHDLGRTLTPEILSSLARPWIVIEDASHEYSATLAVLRFFDPLLRSGEYVVVEDGNIIEMGQDADRGGGPARAIAEFMVERRKDYEIDSRYCDAYGRNVTGNPNGYLRRK